MWNLPKRVDIWRRCNDQCAHGHLDTVDRFFTLIVEQAFGIQLICTNGRPQMTTMNGKRPASMPQRHHQNDASSQHFDLINYIYESWNSVSKELNSYHNQQHGNSSNYRNSALVTYYQEHEPNPQLKDFEPFDLEAYWNQRIVQGIPRNTSS